MVAVIGVEPMTFRVWTERSSQLSYTAIFWCPEAESNHRHGDFQSPALPTELSGHLAERVGFEPTAPFEVTGFQDQLLKPLGHLSIGDLSATRTRDTLIKSQVLYRLS